MYVRFTIAVAFVLLSLQSAALASIPFSFEVVASENGFLTTGKEVFADMPYAASGIYPFLKVNGGVITILNLPPEYVVLNHVLDAESASVTDLQIVFGSGATMIGALETGLLLQGDTFVTGWADFANGFADPVPAIQPYEAGPDAEVGLYLQYGSAQEKKLLSGVFDWLDLEVTIEATNPDLVVVSQATGALTLSSAEAGYENVLQEILVLSGQTGTVHLLTGSFAHAPGLTDPGLFQAEGEASFLFEPTNGNFDNDEDVDGADLLTWQRYPNLGSLADWQQAYGSGVQLVQAATSVPEPISLLLAVCMLSMSIVSRPNK